MKLQSITRASIFQASPFIDNWIAEWQQSYVSSFDVTNPRERAYVQEYYDHRHPYKPSDCQVDAWNVITYRVRDGRDYHALIPLALQKFLLELGITHLYLLDFTKYSLLEFPFRTFRQRNQFKRLGGKKDDRLGYLLPTEVLPEVLPLFFFSRKYDAPVIFLLSEEGGLPLSLRLCDDGNFHLDFQEKSRGLVQTAARNASFEVGGLEICSKYSVHYIK